jgi:hypothetical protein
VKASRLETLGAWLGLWTPPRDVEVPPVPWRKVGYAVAGLAVVAAAIAIFVAPAIDDSKDERSARERQAAAERADARRRAADAEQQPRTGQASGSRPEVMADVEQRIAEDARERFSQNVRAASCGPTPGSDPAKTIVAFDCLAQTSAIAGAGDQQGATGSLGHPYRAVIDFKSNAYAFCKINPVPGETAVPDPNSVVQLPDECRVPD